MEIISKNKKGTLLIKKLSFLLKLKNVKKITIVYENLGNGVGGLMEQTNPNEYLIIVNSFMPKSIQLKAISHEMIHVQQYDRGDFITEVTKTEEKTTVRKFWKGKEICLETTSYLDLPWEKEAHKNMKKVSQFLKRMV